MQESASRQKIGGSAKIKAGVKTAGTRVAHAHSSKVSFLLRAAYHTILSLYFVRAYSSSFSIRRRRIFVSWQIRELRTSPEIYPKRNLAARDENPTVLARDRNAIGEA